MTPIINFLDYSVVQALLATRITGKSNSYARDNPIEAKAVIAYLKAGPRPTTVNTAMGKHLVSLEDARRSLSQTSNEAYSDGLYSSGMYSQ